jgi:hypothetical protein
VATTRTIGPLHFEDLEPKRFEDLVRQLAYEFKPWRRLEATGRAGSDDGFDARGYEIVSKEALERAAPTAPSEDPGQPGADEDEALVEGADDRLWLIQCKREKAIGPLKLVKYLGDIVLAEGEKLHGIVFTAACDFSKTARDKFSAKCRELGFEEWHLWGKAELEDRLFRPENDHLLFAYFGVSLTIRRRSQRADLRARLVMKRKANRILGKNSHQHVLLRSPDDVAYPHSENVPNFKTAAPWVLRRYEGMLHDGLRFLVRRHFAYLSDDGKQWDAALRVNDALSHDDPWRKEEEPWELRAQAHTAWDTFPEANRAWLEVCGIVPFDAVLDIDELGDDYVSAPHVYVPFLDERRGPFIHFYARVQTIENWQPRTLYIQDMKKGRVSQFPEDLRHRERVED